MTKLLEQAVSRAAEQPENDQDVIASLILQELDDERAWTETLARNPEKLERLADEARSEHAAGLTLPLDLSDL